MEELLKTVFLDVINATSRGDSPVWTSIPDVRFEDIIDYTFDVVDPKDDSTTIKRHLGQGVASYINNTIESPYHLRFICYDEYMHQFVFDDGAGHHNASMLSSHKKMADLIVYNISDRHVWFIVHELSTGALKNKRNVGRIQLSSTVDMLCKSERIRTFIDSFDKKCCVLSAKDERVITPNGFADSFMNAYTILPEPTKFQFGAMKKLGFYGYETSKIILKPIEDGGIAI